MAPSSSLKSHRRSTGSADAAGSSNIDDKSMRSIRKKNNKHEKSKSKDKDKEEKKSSRRRSENSDKTDRKDEKTKKSSRKSDNKKDTKKSTKSKSSGESSSKSKDKGKDDKISRKGKDKGSERKSKRDGSDSKEKRKSTRNKDGSKEKSSSESNKKSVRKPSRATRDNEKGEKSKTGSDLNKSAKTKCKRDSTQTEEVLRKSPRKVSFADESQSSKSSDSHVSNSSRGSQSSFESTESGVSGEVSSDGSYMESMSDSGVDVSDRITKNGNSINQIGNELRSSLPSVALKAMKAMKDLKKVEDVTTTITDSNNPDSYISSPSTTISVSKAKASPPGFPAMKSPMKSPGRASAQLDWEKLNRRLTYKHLPKSPKPITSTRTSRIDAEKKAASEQTGKFFELIQKQQHATDPNDPTHDLLASKADHQPRNASIHRADPRSRDEEDIHEEKASKRMSKRHVGEETKLNKSFSSIATYSRLKQNQSLGSSTKMNSSCRMSRRKSHDGLSTHRSRSRSSSRHRRRPSISRSSMSQDASSHRRASALNDRSVSADDKRSRLRANLHRSFSNVERGPTSRSRGGKNLNSSSHRSSSRTRRGRRRSSRSSSDEEDNDACFRGSASAHVRSVRRSHSADEEEIKRLSTSEKASRRKLSSSTHVRRSSKSGRRGTKMGGGSVCSDEDFVSLHDIVKKDSERRNSIWD